jgi:Divergent InlB B-repeat domain
VGVRAKGGTRLATAVIGALVVVGFVAASAPSQGPASSRALNAELQLVTDGPGTLTVAPAEDADSADCKVDAQQYEPGSETSCVQHYESPTKVTLTAKPDTGHSFAGWSDFGCAATSTSCTLIIRTGTRYVGARFSPVSLQLNVNELDDHPFGLISVSPEPLRTCSLNDGDRCEYRTGTVVTLTREFAAPGFFWIGACDGNKGGTLDADTCRLRLRSNEVVGAGYSAVDAIPPPLGSGIVVVVAGRGKVTGAVVNSTGTLDCGTRCSISGLIRYDQVRLTATALRGSHFYRWSNLSRLRTQLIPLSSTNRIQAVFRRN